MHSGSEVLFSKFFNNEKGINGDEGMSLGVISLSFPAGISFYQLSDQKQYRLSLKKDDKSC